MDFHNVVRLPSESTLVMRHVSLATVYWQDGCGACEKIVDLRGP